MQKPVLAIMAAGMGSRFGGLKQIEPIDDEGHIIIDFLLYDAKLAGFEKVVFIIKQEIERDFKAMIGNRIEKHFDVCYVYQELERIPDGFKVPESRKKPWGTAHAAACLKGIINAPFAIINSDDYYGRDALQSIYDYLEQDHTPNEHVMVGYLLRNTVTENGHVARGICEIEKGYLKTVVERTHIEKRGANAAYTENGVDFTEISGDTIVSMNLWGFQPSMLDVLDSKFVAFLKEQLPSNPEKCEYFLPSVVDSQIQENCASVRVLNTDEVWYGVTYRKDLQIVVDAVKRMKASGKYPTELWRMDE